MERINCDGCVIKTAATGEADMILFIFTRSMGIIRAFAKGARNTKSRLHSAATLFAYCEFGLYEKNGVYTVTEADVKNVFFELRSDIKSLTLAQYFCEIALKCIEENQSEEELLRLLLNSLHLLCKGEKDILLIKSVFELRFCVISGYMPRLVGCSVCGAFETEKMSFNCETGELFCSECSGYMPLPEVSGSVISAMRHISFSDFAKIFSFELSHDKLEILSRLTETYTRNCFGQKFRLTEFFDMVK